MLICWHIPAIYIYQCLYVGQSTIAVVSFAAEFLVYFDLYQKSLFGYGNKIFALIVLMATDVNETIKNFRLLLFEVTVAVVLQMQPSVSIGHKHVQKPVRLWGNI